MRKIFAKIFDVPFFIKEHWPQFYAMGYTGGGINERFKVNLFDHYSKEGSVVYVLTDNRRNYYYKITRISYAPGGDWGIYSNKQFDLKYHHSEKTKTHL